LQVRLGNCRTQALVKGLWGVLGYLKKIGREVQFEGETGQKVKRRNGKKGESLIGQVSFGINFSNSVVNGYFSQEHREK